MKRFMFVAGLTLAVPFFSFAAEPAPAASPEAKKVTVEIKIGTGIENRDVTGEGTAFEASTPQVVGWTLVEGAAEPTDIVHEWLKDGVVVSSVTLPVKSSHFRTYSRKTLNGQVGQWTLQVKDASGAVLGTKNFEVTQSSSTPAK